VNYHTSDSLRLLTRERLEQRVQEADAERLAREIRGTARHRRRPRLSVALALGASRRAALRPGSEWASPR
jgi:hypothetical protein